MEKKMRFCLCYVFQAAVNALWCERNRIKHGERSRPVIVLKKMIDKGVRNKLSLLRSKGVKMMQSDL